MRAFIIFLSLDASMFDSLMMQMYISGVDEMFVVSHGGI